MKSENERTNERTNERATNEHTTMRTNERTNEQISINISSEDIFMKIQMLSLPRLLSSYWQTNSEKRERKKS